MMLPTFAGVWTNPVEPTFSFVELYWNGPDGYGKYLVGYTASGSRIIFEPSEVLNGTIGDIATAYA